MENNISFQNELSKSIVSSKSNLKDVLERLQFLASNFDGSEEHLRALDFVEGCVSIEFANLRQLSKMHCSEVAPPSIFKKVFRFFGFNARTL